jgi:hypothetical protein
MGLGLWRAAALGAVTALGVSVAIAVTAPGASAKSAYESPYGYERTWSTKPTAGSLELVRSSGGDALVSVLVQLPQMPHYHEQVLLDALASKMRREYGDAPVHHRKVEEPAPDAGDAGSD